MRVLKSIIFGLVCAIVLGLFIFGVAGCSALGGKPAPEPFQCSGSTIWSSGQIEPGQPNAGTIGTEPIHIRDRNISADSGQFENKLSWYSYFLGCVRDCDWLSECPSLLLRKDAGHAFVYPADNCDPGCGGDTIPSGGICDDPNTVDEEKEEVVKVLIEEDGEFYIPSSLVIMVIVILIVLD